MNEPTKFRSGDTIKWSESNADYKASDGWTLKYFIRGTTSLDINAAANGDNFDITITAAQSATLVPGNYSYQGRFEKGAEAYTPAGYAGHFDVLANLFVQGANYEARTHYKKVLDALEATIQRRATKEQQEMIIDGKQLKFLSMAELLKAYQNYKFLVQQEQTDELIDKGLDPGNQHKIQFTQTS